MWRRSFARSIFLLACSQCRTQTGCVRVICGRGYSTASSEAVLLYWNNKTRPGYFRLIAVVSGIQLSFWLYLSYFALIELRDEEREKDEVKNPNSLTDAKLDTGEVTRKQHDSESTELSVEPTKPKVWYTSLKWRLSLSVLSLSAGLFFAITACMYPLRVVHRLYFMRPTTAIQIHTYTPFGSTRFVNAPLSNIACTGDRASPQPQLALKVKGYPLYFLVDKQGVFVVPRLFDTLIATRKKIL